MARRVLFVSNMSNEASGAGETVKAKSKKPILLIALVVLNMIAVAAVGAYVAFAPQGAHAAAPAEAAEPEAEEERGPVIDIDPMVVNLHTDGASRYLKVGFSLQLRSEEDKEHVTLTIAPIRDRVLVHLSSRTPEQVRGPEKMAELREELKAMIQEIAGEERVPAIYFTEFFVQ